MIQEFSRQLAARGTPGIHLVCGLAPVGFYRRLGFSELALVEDPVTLRLMGRRLSR